MSARPPATAALLAAALLAANARADDPTAVLLGVLDVATAPGLAGDAPLLANLELNPSGPSKLTSLREWFPRARVSGGRVAVVLDGRAPPAQGRPTARQWQPSFLVDFDRPEAAAFRDALAARGALSDEELARFVDGWITRKTMSRGIDVASRVAAHREGDCSEHAVLLAAAARLSGRASRVIIGVALFPVDGRLRGFGHAWTEIHDGRAWQAVDATPLPAGVRYLPLGAIADEGPGHLGSAWALLSPIDVRRIVLEAAPSAAR
jgi:transglutaminase-like putative cysteine protease